MAIECVEIQEWVEEEITKPIEEWVEKSEEKCKNWPWPLNWVCKVVTTLVKVVTWVVEKVGKWVVRTVCKVVSVVVSTVLGILTGLWDVLVGIFTLDWRRIIDGLIGIAIAIIDFIATAIRIGFLGDTIDYIIEEINKGKLRDYVRDLLEDKYTGDELQNIKDTLRVDYGAFGYRISMRSVRTFLDSETPSSDEAGVPNLVVLHEQGDINLRELCGFEFTEGFWNRKRYKTLKKETVVTGGGGGEFDNPISEDELDTYLSSRGAEGPDFIVLPMRDGVLKTKLRAAELKARELGLMPQWIEESQEVIQPDHINHNGFDTNIASSSLVRFLIDTIGRTDSQLNESGALAELCTPVAAGVFRYTDNLRGIAACLKGSTCQQTHDASGVTFIDNKPDIIWKYVPIHELGHYFGLCHVDGIDRIMYSSKQNSWIDLWTLPKLLYTKGEPSFTLDEAKQTWDYIVAHFPARCLGGNAEAPID